MKAFLLSFRSEFYKSRKTLGFWCAVILPLLITALVFAGFFFKADKMLNDPAKLLWIRFTSVPLNVMGILLLPMFVIFTAYSVNNIEHRADTWKTLFSLPLPRFAVYAAKYFYAMALLFLCLLLFALFTIGFGNLLGNITLLKFAGYSLNKTIFEIYLKLFLSALGILSIQFLLSILWKDFLKPMGFGFICTIAAIIMGTNNWEHAYLFPYAHPFLALRTMMPKGNWQKRWYHCSLVLGGSISIAIWKRGKLSLTLVVLSFLSSGRWFAMAAFTGYRQASIWINTLLILPTSACWLTIWIRNLSWWPNCLTLPAAH